MTIAEKLQYLKGNNGINYSFVAKKIGTTYNRLYRHILPKDNKNWTSLLPHQLKALNDFLNGFEFPQ
ncbi:hypothetical protein HMPREF1084_04005 [Clostridium butyricum 60E.3]|uniref:hypothetical protein n=1 Tax=Clostridium butyricum TaxID=1492 RepID=UPI0002D15253|nr:hypothetical protein [Clostridium butyricum]ENZ30159.1 hypothetical protein HMPREF1084_04005 [Clostridium butyricum 60E.3]